MFQQESGATGLCSGRRTRPGNRKLDEGLAVRALTIIRELYADFGPTLACEKLRECHGLVLSKETVRHLMTDAGLWVPPSYRISRFCQPCTQQFRPAHSNSSEPVTRKTCRSPAYAPICPPISGPITCPLNCADCR